MSATLDLARDLINLASVTPDDAGCQRFTSYPFFVEPVFEPVQSALCQLFFHTTRHLGNA